MNETHLSRLGWCGVNISFLDSGISGWIPEINDFVFDVFKNNYVSESFQYLIGSISA